MIILYELNIFEIWERWVWKNWNCSFLSLCCLKGKLILNMNSDIIIWFCWKWLFKRKGSWKLYLWTYANFSLASKFIRKLLPILCDYSSLKIFLFPWSEMNWEDFNKRHANKPYFSWTLWTKIGKMEHGRCYLKLV